MPNQTLARRYAQAVFELAQPERREEVGSDLRSIWNAIQSDENVLRFFAAPIVDRAQKEKVVASAVRGQAGDLALHFVLLLVRKRRERLFPEIITQYEALVQASRGAEPLTIVSARELPQNELDRMVARLSKVYGKNFEVRQRVDPSLLGGVRIRMGDLAVDASVAGKLDDLARTLLAPH